MRANNNLIFTTIGAVLLLTLNTTTVLASDAAKEDKHQHHTAKTADKKPTDNHEHQGHQCDHKMSSVDTDKDGRISREEFIKHHELMFDKKDSNKDGFLDESEMHHMMGHKHKHMHDHGNQSKEGGHAHSSDSKK